ncbi:MAG TPA: cytochrome c oxidase subunit 3 [Tepidisphaeraceae bacterium]|jgi:heme/copper-type cytochrome/quinol oxidase subunit 3|nr:cytochrome c oxidase subunit 3 [Tepidisphaeraceae bacterium]
MTQESPPNPPRPPGGLKSGFHTPVRTSTIGMNLFLASLFMLFGAGMVGYVIVRVATEKKLPRGDLIIPQALWISTAIVVIASFTIQRAVTELRHEHQPAFRRWLLTTLLLAIAFVIIQCPSLTVLFMRQREMLPKKIALYGLMFVLIILHAAHVIGGIIALGWTYSRARKGAYDHETFHPVARVALYWHFLDAVWLVMFLTFDLVK